MRIAYIGNFSQRHCTEVHLAATLERLGHEVIRLQEDGMTPDTLHTMIAAQGKTWSMLLFTRTWGKLLTDPHLTQLRNLGVPTASYHLDLYVGLQRKYLHEGKPIEQVLQTDPFWRTDYVFTPDGDPASQKVFEANGVNHHYIKPGVFKPECYRANPEQGNEIDVLFVGGGDRPGSKHIYGHPEWDYRNQLIGWLYDTYGERFKKFGHPQATIRNAELNQLYANAKVVVGDSLCPEFKKPYYWSDRVYETMGRGGFLIHPYIKGLEEEFTNGKDIVFYDYGNFDQLKRKIDYYLEHDEEREAIREAGHQHVREHCTYDERLSQMLGIVFGAEELPTHSSVPIATPEATKDMRKKDRSRFSGLRGQIFKRDNYQCVKCGMTMGDHLEKFSKSLTIHHIDGEGRNSKEPNNDPSNLQTLCLPCHGKEDGQRTTKNQHGEFGKLKISLGAGAEPEGGSEWVNVDIVPLEGIDKVHNLMVYPWPFDDESAEYIKAKDIIEHMATHLPDGRSSLIAFIEECYRILKPGGTLWIQTPAHDAPFLWIDPTHVRGFHEQSFDFFDPDTDFGRSTGFYSEAKFKVSVKRLENGNLQFNLEKL